MRNIFISTEETSNPNSLKFLPDHEVLDDAKPRDFPNKNSAKVSPLARNLFSIEGVKSVHFGSNFLIVTKENENNIDWETLRPKISDVILNHFSKKLPVINKNLDQLEKMPNWETKLRELEEEHQENMEFYIKLIIDEIKPNFQKKGQVLIFEVSY